MFGKDTLSLEGNRGFFQHFLIYTPSDILEFSNFFSLAIFWVISEIVRDFIFLFVLDHQVFVFFILHVIFQVCNSGVYSLCQTFSSLTIAIVNIVMTHEHC